MYILLIEDNSDHVLLIERLFVQIGAVRFEHVASLNDGLSRMKEQQFDVILCDLGLPDSPIEHTVKRLNAIQTDTPIVVLTSLESRETESAMAKEGIQDYIPKSELSANLLRRVCQYAIARKRIQNQLEEQNDKMQSFCNYLMRDFKTPIRQIMHETENLRHNLQTHDLLHKTQTLLIDSISKNAKTTIALADDLHQYLTIDYEDAEFTLVDTRMLLDGVDVLIDKSSHRDISISIEGDFPVVMGNEGLLSLLISNVLNNSIKYNLRNPNIVIRGTVNRDLQLGEISVIDNGIGIDPVNLETIFSPFVRLYVFDDNDMGSGLGLGLVKRITEMHRGTISIESVVDQGTRLTFLFPLSAESGTLMQA